MDDSRLSRLEGEHAALRALLGALIDSHPDADVLAKWLRWHAATERGRAVPAGDAHAFDAGFGAGLAWALQAIEERAGRRNDPQVLDALLAALPPDAGD